MLNWNDAEKAQCHRDDLLREAAADRRLVEVDRPRRSWSPILVPLVAAHRWLHELDAVAPRELSSRIVRSP